MNVCLFDNNIDEEQQVYKHIKIANNGGHGGGGGGDGGVDHDDCGGGADYHIGGGAYSVCVGKMWRW